MKLLLRESIRGVGKRGDVVDVTDGYARNYLLPKNLAMPASDENLRRLAGEKRAYEARQVQQRETVASGSACRGLGDAQVAGQSKVVVAAEIQKLVGTDLDLGRAEMAQRA